MEINVAHADVKNVCPKDLFELDNLSQEEINKHYMKPVRGHVIISDADNGEILATPNLVLLSGREFLAQKLADITSETLIHQGTFNLSDYKIRYFGVGQGGASPVDGTSKIGPYDVDLDLNNPGKFGNIDLMAEDAYRYIHDGSLKRIQSDNGSIEIVAETHAIDNNQSIGAMTTIKYTMFIKKEELDKENNAFAFNEAALYAVDFDGGGPKANPDGNRTVPEYRAFAKFTTDTKMLTKADSLKIEWFILT